MPELPEVERARRILQRAAVSRRIVAVRCADDPIVFDRVAAAQIMDALLGREVLAAMRRGKHVWLEMSGEGPALIMHLGMTGHILTPDTDPLWLVSSPRSRTLSWPPRYWKILLTLHDGGEVAMTNARRFGRIRLRQDPAKEDPIGRLGFDPLTDMLPLGELELALRGRHGTMKGLLLNQSFVAGVGNWIADEVLYHAGVDPRRRPSSLSSVEARRLHEALRDVIARACEVDADSARFPEDWLFHVRWGEAKATTTHDGAAIERLQIAGRTTVFVPSAQR